MQIYKDKCFFDPVDIITAFDNAGVVDAFVKIEKYKAQNKYLLGYVRYETKDVFLGKEITSEFPLVYFEVFDSYNNFEPYLPQNRVNIYSESEISYEKYIFAFEKIKSHIANGNTYEVNYTYPFNVYTAAESINLYNHLIQKQKTEYNCFISNKYEHLLSFSPELFFKLEGSKILTKPMKGTMPRGSIQAEDDNNRAFLVSDEKNKAENVMIVDLLRNDLSKIAKTGSVKVDKLFEIESHPTVFQMTSEISAELQDNTTLYDIFNALFPCGSITGAPKRSTIDIIDELEYFRRDIYCGAIGFISPDECVFSVPIRILQKKCTDNFYRYFTGGAIVWDSDVFEEWNETQVKKKIVDTDLEYKLVETMLVEDGEVNLFDYHKIRIMDSADKLGFNFHPKDFVFDTSKNCIVRFLLSKDGETEVEYLDIYPTRSNKIKISKFCISKDNMFLGHKTTFRPWYKRPLKDLFDVIFTNEKGELVEGTRSNIVLKLDGELYTPPISAGLLNGTYRQYLIDTNKIKERILFVEDLKIAEKIYCINSVRRMVEVELV